MRRSRLFAAGLLLLTAQGCRCNSVDDKDLPTSTSASATPPPASAVATATASAKPDAIDCGPAIGGIDAVTGTSLVLLGELHGLRAAPIAALDLACRLALQDTTQTVTLALEISTGEQARIDAFMASPGAEADRRALVAGPFWTGTQDGRASQARLDMLERARALRQKGVQLRIVTIDATSGPKRDQEMANKVLAAVEEKRGPVIVLAGNLHTRTRGGKKDERWMGEYLRDKLPDVVSFDNRYGTGEAWVCTATCGVQPVTGKDEPNDTRWRLERFTTPDENGHVGAWHIGPAKASPPAVAK